MISLHYNGSNSLSFVNAAKLCNFKAKDSEIEPFPLCLPDISKDFTLDNMKKITVNKNCKSFSCEL